MAFSVLDALNKNSKSGIDDTPKARSATKDISVFKIYPNTLNFYPQSEIDEKAEEILAVGLIENLAVTYKPSDKGEYKLISGERRWRALKLLIEKGYKEFETVTCQIRTPDNEQEEKIEIILANSHRSKDITTLLQEEKELKETLEYMKANNIPLKGYDLQTGRLRDIIARMLNTSKTKVAQIENINNNLIPEFQEEVKGERLTFSAAAEIAGMPEEKQKEVLEKYQEAGNVSYAEVKELKKAEKEPENPEEAEPEAPEETAKPKEDFFEPEPDRMTTPCYSCQNWDKCTEKGADVINCHDFKHRNNPGAKSDRELEAESNIKTTPIEQKSHPEQPVTPEKEAKIKEPHSLKTAPMYFEDLLSGIKTFELRKNDRDFKVGDILMLREFKDGEHTGREIKAEITYMLEDYMGLTEKYCILGIKKI